MKYAFLGVVKVSLELEEASKGGVQPTFSSRVRVNFMDGCDAMLMNISAYVILYEL